MRSIKRKMGSDARVSMGGQQFTPQQISAFILRELKGIAERNLGEPTPDVVITVPAYFTDAARQATHDAGASLVSTCAGSSTNRPRPPWPTA